MSSADVSECLGVLESFDADELEPLAIQRLVAAAIKLYMTKRESGCEFLPVQDDALTATDVSVTTLGLLKSAQLEPFELTLWGRFGQI